MPNLREYAEMMRTQGLQRFQRQFGAPALVIVGIGGELEEGRGRANTIATKLSDALQESLALSERVFHLVRAKGAPVPSERNSPLYVGRTAESDVVIADYTISVRHCYFGRNLEQGFVLCDCGSTNGTWLNKVKLAPHAPVPIAEGSEVTLGRLIFKFHTAEGFIARVVGVLSAEQAAKR